THWHLALSWQFRGVVYVVRALNGTLGAGVALAVVVSLFHNVLVEDVQPQWPLAVLADLNHPPLNNFVLVVGDLVLQGDFFKSLGKASLYRLRFVQKQSRMGLWGCSELYIGAGVMLHSISRVVVEKLLVM